MSAMYVGEMAAQEVGETGWMSAHGVGETNMWDELFGPEEMDEQKVSSDEDEESWEWHEEIPDTHETKELNAGWVPFLKLRMEQHRGCIVIRGFECEYPKESGEKWFAHFVKSGRYEGQFRWKKWQPQDFGPKIKVVAIAMEAQLLLKCVLVWN
jgi:hypothetical protein